MHLYSARIPTLFLAQLDNPDLQASPDAVAFQVHRTDIPYKPYDTLQQRILGLLFPTGVSGIASATIVAAPTTVTPTYVPLSSSLWVQGRNQRKSKRKLEAVRPDGEGDKENQGQSPEYRARKLYSSPGKG